jgi:threonine-phosphate decarboxylase
MHKFAREPAEPAPLFRHGDAHGRSRRPLLDFSVSLNPLGPPPSVLQAVRRGLSAIAGYPDPACRELTERLARLHGVGSDQVVAGNGSNELIHAIPRAFRPSRVAIVEPTYTEYLRASLLAGADVAHWLAEGDDFLPGPFDPEGAVLVWLGNPNNPTGRLWPPGSLAPWLAAHPRTLFVVDEAFLPFRTDEAEHSLIPAVNRLPNLIVVRSLTKLYTVPGLRLGYAVAGPQRAACLRAQVVPWSVNALAQVAGLAALEDDAFLATTRGWFQDTQAAFLGQLRACSDHLHPLPSEANFVLLRLKSWTAGWLAERLEERGLAVRDAANFVGLDNHYVRVAVRRAEDNQRLLEELRILSLEERFT